MTFLPKNKFFALLVPIFLCALPFERLLTVDFHGYTVKLSYLIGLFLLFSSFFVIKSIYRFVTLDEIILLLFNLSNFASVLYAIDHKRALIISFVILFLSLLYFILKRVFSDKLRFYLNIILIISVAVSVFGLWQFFADQYCLGPSFLRDAYTKTNFGFPRIQSTFLEPLYFANFLFIGLYSAIYLYIVKKKNLYLAALLVMAVAFFLALSRGAFFALALSSVVALILVISRFRSILKEYLFALAVIAVSFVLAITIIFFVSETQGLKNYLSHAVSGEILSTNLSYKEILRGSQSEEVVTNPEVLTSRAYTTKTALASAIKHPFGIGVGNFGVLPEFRSLLAGGSYQTVNNIYLEILVESGIIGLMLFIFFLVLIAQKIFIDVKENRPESILYLGILIALLAQYLFFSTLYIIYIWVFLALIMRKERS